MQQTRNRWWLILLPPLMFLLKDIIATIAVLSTEPGITAKAKLYYVIALIPGGFVVDNASSAIFVNVIVGAFISLILYILLIQRKRFAGRLRHPSK